MDPLAAEFVDSYLIDAGDTYLEMFDEIGETDGFSSAMIGTTLAIPSNSCELLISNVEQVVGGTYLEMFDEIGETDGFSSAMIGTTLAIPSNSCELLISNVKQVVGGVGDSASQYCMADINAAIGTVGCFSRNPLLCNTLPVPRNSGESFTPEVEQVCGVIGGSTPQHSMAAINVKVNSGAAAKSIQALREMTFAEQFAQTDVLKARGPGGFDMNLVANSRPKRQGEKLSKDPQSVIARHRRVRIGDRMRILQVMIPDCNCKKKMNIDSVLDKAVHYIKFLKEVIQSCENDSNTHNTSFDSPGGFRSKLIVR